ncbi:MAG: thioredoxin [Spirochaetes bacterium]|jgi:thioredoxin-like negative regulator of GroEL|nr:thioredoxin [Spirochaetota bacterium]
MTRDELTTCISETDAILLYVTTTDCSVCNVLKPKVRELLEERFPRMEFIDIEMDLLPEAGRDFEVYSVPTVIGFFQGKEHFRKVRVFGIEELAEAIERPYEILFG